MKYFYSKTTLISLGIFWCVNLSRAALPFGVFPFLTTGWYYKPGPVESIVLGLIVVKVWERFLIYQISMMFKIYNIRVHGLKLTELM